MKPTKIAFDPNRGEIKARGGTDKGKALLDVRLAMRDLILNAMTDGDIVRTLKMTGHPSLARAIANGNELHAKALEQLIDQFELYINKGFGFNAAIYQLMEDGWVEKIGNFVLQEFDNG